MSTILFFFFGSLPTLHTINKVKKIGDNKWVVVNRGEQGGLTLTVRWIILARFLGLCGNLEPLMTKKSSSFSLFVKAIANFGGHTWGKPASPLPPDEDPPFLLSCAVSDVAADLLLLSLW